MSKDEAPALEIIAKLATVLECEPAELPSAPLGAETCPSPPGEERK